MARVKRPLNRSIIIVWVAFIVLLCAVLTATTFIVYRKNYDVYTKKLRDKYINDMYARYETQLYSIVTYAESYIDHDDMSECSKTFIESEKYKEFQEFFDHLIDNYEDIHYLYIMKVGDIDEEVPIHEICAANSTYEKENEPDMVLHLGDGEADWFDREQVIEYKEILDNQIDVYFINESTWGVDYTLARPLRDSSGYYYGLLCADISIDEINRSIQNIDDTMDDINKTVYSNIFIIITTIAITGGIFIGLLIVWMRKNVTTPLMKLENSVTEFAKSSADKRDPEDLTYIAPDIHTKNEVESLANAYAKLSHDMRDYVIGIVAAENETKSLKEHVSEINAIAYHDALTHVKNKAAYEEKRLQMSKEIEKNKAEFGIVMADINSLKTINDKYGHKKGDEYIKGACKIICDIYAHSNVYRIGGDEFVVLIQKRDYENRDKLLELARAEFERTANDKSVDPWHRYSAALGMAILEEEDTFDKVFSRADHFMYDDKKVIKAKLKVE